MTFYDRLTELRKEKGITQKKLTEELNLGKNSFGDWKKGIIPLRSTQQFLAQYFGVSIDYLMGYTDIKEKPTTDKDDELSQEFKSLYSQLTPEQREIVLAAMREFSKEK